MSSQAISTRKSSLQAMTTIMSNQRTMATGQASKSVSCGNAVPYALLHPVIHRQLDEDRAMQLQTVYLKMKKNEVSKVEFVRSLKSIVGEQMIKMAVYKVQSQVEWENAAPGTLKDEFFDMQSSRMGVSTPTSMRPSNSVSSSISTQTLSPISLDSDAKTPLKKSSFGQKKQLEALGSSPPLSIKKHRVSGAYLDQSINN